jgi:hypothetical protein
MAAFSTPLNVPVIVYPPQIDLLAGFERIRDFRQYPVFLCCFWGFFEKPAGGISGAGNPVVLTFSDIGYRISCS